MLDSRTLLPSKRHRQLENPSRRSSSRAPAGPSKLKTRASSPAAWIGSRSEPCWEVLDVCLLRALLRGGRAEGIQELEADGERLGAVLAVLDSNGLQDGFALCEKCSMMDARRRVKTKSGGGYGRNGSASRAWPSNSTQTSPQNTYLRHAASDCHRVAAGRLHRQLHKLGHRSLQARA